MVGLNTPDANLGVPPANQESRFRGTDEGGGGGQRWETATEFLAELAERNDDGLRVDT